MENEAIHHAYDDPSAGTWTRSAAFVAPSNVTCRVATCGGTIARPAPMRPVPTCGEKDSGPADSSSRGHQCALTCRTCDPDEAKACPAPQAHALLTHPILDVNKMVIP